MPAKIVDCPVCGIAMQKRIVRDGIEIDFCDWHGVWLDAGELERLLALQGGGQASGRGGAIQHHPHRGVPHGHLPRPCRGFLILLVGKKMKKIKLGG